MALLGPGGISKVAAASTRLAHYAHGILTGIEGVEPTDKAVDHHGALCYGAIGVGGMKMKLHKAAIAKLFTAKDLVFDAEQIYEIGRALTSERVSE